MQLASETEPTFSMGSCSANPRFPSQSNSWTVHGDIEGLYEMSSLLQSGIKTKQQLKYRKHAVD